jgi:hypothetical protein
MNQDQVKLEMKEVLNQIDQATGTLEQLTTWMLERVSGENWSRTLRGDIRKERISPPDSALGVTALNLRMLVTSAVKLTNIIRDVSGIPRGEPNMVGE